MQWTDEADPAKGFSYLYLDPADYGRLTAAGNAVKVRNAFARVLVMC